MSTKPKRPNDALSLPSASLPSAKELVRDRDALLRWYKVAKRDLPWRLSRDPYRIWISEVMLQQTTVAAVIPYYEKFIAKFSTIDALASAPLGEVYALWAGLGYYSRARLLHQSAQRFAASGFPHGADELATFPGFGPYTSRAVASLAFDQQVGVLDGNVIRILSRRYGLALEWWAKPARAQLQDLADRFAQGTAPADVNQAMMELGATVCTAQAPACLLCPWKKSCKAWTLNRVAELPLRRPRRAREIWLWQPEVRLRAGKVQLVEQAETPFLKKHWSLPGKATRLDAPPKDYNFRGTVTHHDIFVQVKVATSGRSTAIKSRWIGADDDELKREVPASLIRKAITLARGPRTVSMIAPILAPIVALLFLGGCAVKSRVTPATKVAAQAPAQAAAINLPTDRSSMVITSGGRNLAPQFSPDGQYVAYESSLRAGLNKSQIFIYSLALKKERRLTFHDRDDLRPRWLSPTVIEFSSPVDDSKTFAGTLERLIRTHGASPPSPSSSPSPGVTTLGPGNLDASKLELFTISLDGQRKFKSTARKDKNHDEFGRPLVPAVPLKDEWQNIDPVWTRDRKWVVFSSNREGQLKIFAAPTKGECAIKIIEIAGYDLRQPALSRDGKQIALSAEHGEAAQVVISDFKTPSGCDLADKQLKLSR